MSNPPLPEIREADAPPHIAAIYADIKESAALPQVNLIFRYLPTHPGALEWVWQTLKPLYTSRELADAAVTLMGAIERPGASPLADVLNGDERDACRTVLASYNSGNPQNLLALTALVHLLENPTISNKPVSELTPRPKAAASQPATFPPLPRRDALAPHDLARIEKMASRHGGAPGVIPSMYLHLALWPQALDAVDTYLQLIVESASWKPRVDAVRQAGNVSASRFAPALRLAPDPPPRATLDEVAGTIKTFVGATIPELIVVGRLLAID
ncbi:MAG: halocarboxylic acid dehydrogenase DehI family protein [Alphaproteobacteria bacterium]|nr:halocarboxylic acid dehydrogenase DehI family protein [Alphaproteobacteria bacterium]